MKSDLGVGWRGGPQLTRTTGNTWVRAFRSDVKLTAFGRCGGSFPFPFHVPANRDSSATGRATKKIGVKALEWGNKNEIPRHPSPSPPQVCWAGEKGGRSWGTGAPRRIQTVHISHCLYFPPRKRRLTSKWTQPQNRDNKEQQISSLEGLFFFLNDGMREGRDRVCPSITRFKVPLFTSSFLIGKPGSC